MNQSLFHTAWRVFRSAVFTAVIVSALGVASLLAVALLPQSSLHEHAAEGFSTHFLDDNYPIYANFRGIDMYTECVGLALALQMQPNLTSIFTMSGFAECNNLRNRIATGGKGGGHYARYWHGYQLALKPLYTLFSAQTVRIVCIATGTLLLILLGWILWRKADLGPAISIVAGGVMASSLSPFSVATHGVQLWLVLVAGIFACSHKEEKAPVGLFALIGGCAAFVSFLNMESLSLGVALFCWTAVQLKTGKAPKDIVIQGIALCAAWGLAFLLTWVAKWGLAFTFVDSLPNFFGNTIKNYPARSFFSITNALKRCVFFSPWWLVAGGFAVLLIRFRALRLRLPQYVWVYGLTALVPLAWLTCLPVHAAMHAGFMSVILWPLYSAICVALWGESKSTDSVHMPYL